MNDSISQMRRDFSGTVLDQATTPSKPFELFQSWWNDAVAAEIEDINACALATASKDGLPQVRMVLLKGWSELGFDFYTNYGSRKSLHLIENPRAEMLFWWAPISRQVRITGDVVRLSRKESEDYFSKRPRASQLSASASEQSEVISNRKILEDEVEKLNKRYDGQAIPCPENWGGYRIQANSIEFWQGQPSRLHDRIRYQLQESGGWLKQRLAP